MTAPTAIVLVDDDAITRHLLAHTLETAGHECVAVESPSLALEGLERGSFALLLVESTLAQRAPENLLARVCSSAPCRVRVVLLVAPGCEAEVARGFALGADDCLRKSAAQGELLARVRAQLQLRDCALQLAQRQAEQQTLRELTEQLASSVDVRHLLLTVVQQTAALATVDRCSIVLFGDQGQLGYVLASSDDAGLTDLPIDLAAYPEIREVMTSGRTLVVTDPTQHPLMCEALMQEAARRFQCRVVVPLAHDHGAIGVLFLRSLAPQAFSVVQLSLLGTIANATAIALRNARILQRMRAETELSATARVEAERRIRLFRRYADFFESAADGMVVIDRSGKVLFANPRALEITGFAQSELLGVPFQLFLHPSEHERATQVLRGFDGGVYPRGTDFSLQSRSGRRVVVGVSFSAVLHEDNAVLFSFRDVTSERRTAVELTQTKEFLECVIDSSVDGIVSADLRGTLLLLNRAAARIFGYVPAEVIGRMNVDKLYPPGVARDVMRKIRDPALSGDGRLEDYRVDMVRSDGTTVQVLLSASLVVANGAPIGSVGIFTDIRDKLRIQDELERAQEALRAREKQAILAELAGAAAHELNQPLTSVLGYAELLRRRLADSPQHLAPLQIISDEAHRMAEIVRKVGRITRYETKTYVGGARILDLEKASGPDPPPDDG